MKKLYRVTTEGDCEGRSVRTLGLYSGEIKDIVAQLLIEGKNPYYGYDFTEAKITDVKPGIEPPLDKEINVKHVVGGVRVVLEKRKTREDVRRDNLSAALRATRDLSPEQLQELIKYHQK